MKKPMNLLGKEQDQPRTFCCIPLKVIKTQLNELITEVQHKTSGTTPGAADMPRSIFQDFQKKCSIITFEIEQKPNSPDHS